MQENNSENTPPSKPNTDFHASERVSRSSAQSPYVKMDDLERLLEEVVRRGAEAAFMTNRRSRWGPRNQVRRSPRQEEKKIWTPLEAAGHHRPKGISAKDASRTIRT
ncbi:hypothetical protein Salat_0183200 [Sesamum alatum]|uniref:Uncharacterized protein n=1 Tax=Sesamum alatum TaxID=300844 RepID=A0AAE1YY89_9LAMI|nr:hypothetical protein Salat_0183200 [Sesamum alatum]